MNQTVCVVGGGDSALEEALTLTHFASRVVLVHRGEAFDGQQALVDRVLAAPSIEVRWRHTLEEIVGDGTVQSVKLRDVANDQSVNEAISGVFIFVGLEPNGGLLEGIVPLDRSGHIRTDIWMRTEVPGIFAVGDVRQHSASQLITAAGRRRDGGHRGVSVRARGGVAAIRAPCNCSRQFWLATAFTVRRCPCIS